MLEKHSITIAGHRTSFSLEREFWLVVRQIAKQRNMSLSGLVAQIDSERDKGVNLSSALRLHVLETLQARLEQDSPKEA